MQSAARAKVPAGRHVDLQLNDRRFEKESQSAVIRAFMSEHGIAPQAPADRLRWQNLVVVETAAQSSPGRRLSKAALPVHHALQNGASSPKTRQRGIVAKIDYALEIAIISFSIHS
jgi:hypothetical protein